MVHLESAVLLVIDVSRTLIVVKVEWVAY